MLGNYIGVIYALIRVNAGIGLAHLYSNYSFLLSGIGSTFSAPLHLFYFFLNQKKYPRNYYPTNQTIEQ